MTRSASESLQVDARPESYSGKYPGNIQHDGYPGYPWIMATAAPVAVVTLVTHNYLIFTTQLPSDHDSVQWWYCQ